MKKHATSFLFYSTVSWLLGCLVYMLLETIMPSGNVFGRWYRMFLYHYQHPYQYILVVALSYGFIATVWTRFYGYLIAWKRAISIIMVMLFSLVIASVLGGVLWAIHDIQAGFLPPLDVLWGNLTWAATTGLTFGWVIIGLSIPYNILCGISGYFLTHYGQRYLEERG